MINDCNECKFIQPNEVIQIDNTTPHICKLLNERVYHFDTHPKLNPLRECPFNNKPGELMFPEFRGFNKIFRYSRDCIITEKINGSNGVLYINENNNIFAGSRNRWLWGSIQDEIHNDNMGFGQWVKTNKEELLKLGKGYHYGEWWGKGIQTGYNLKEKRFSLFNVSRWVKDKTNVLKEKQEYCPECCYVVPILYEGKFDTELILGTLQQLKMNGSYASPGFMNPEGIVIFHTQSGYLFKKTFENEEKGKEN